MKRGGSFTRRKFLLFGLGTAAAGLYAAYKWRWGNPAEVVVAILERRVGYLKVESSTFYDFARSYVERRDGYERQARRLTPFAPALRFMSPYDWLRPGRRLRQLEDNVVSLYLLSTDFFQNGADEQRAVTYVSFYDPHSALCRNPFARQP